MYQPSNLMGYKTMYAPMSSESELEFLHGLVEKAVEQGATLEVGAKRIEGMESTWYKRLS